MIQPNSFTKSNPTRKSQFRMFYKETCGRGNAPLFVAADLCSQRLACEELPIFHGWIPLSFKSLICLGEKRAPLGLS